MRAGALDRTITLQRSTTTISDGGQPSQVWSDLATVRAQQVQASTDEFIRGYGASEKTVVVFRMWWLDGITNADRVLYGGQTLNIKEIKELGRRAGVELRCEALT